MRKYHTGTRPLACAAFQVAQGAPNQHTGQLISPSAVPASVSETWAEPPNAGIVVIRLTRWATGGPR
ncbi:MAG TPA: hypothetical protein VFW96_26990 [Thermomicrobiales bacterium]|nr:hypothetical protein [Thermomicrobiales bacterium]